MTTMYDGDYLEWIDYKKRGGTLDFEDWYEKYCSQQEEEDQSGWEYY